MIAGGEAAIQRRSGGANGLQGAATLIANRASGSGRGKAPIRIQAQVLRDRQACAGASATVGFIMPEDCAQPARPEKPAGRWRQADVKRAIVAAQSAGLAGYRIEIAPDGTISIVVGAPAEKPEAP